MMPCDDSRLFDEFHPPLRKFWKLWGLCPQEVSLRPLTKTAGVVSILVRHPNQWVKIESKAGILLGLDRIGRGRH